MENLTAENENYTDSYAGPLSNKAEELFIILNIFLSITAFLGNALILVALHKVTSIHTPKKILFRCLAVTDLCIGLITQPVYAVNFIPEIADSLSGYNNLLVGTSTFILCTVSILISTAISVDRLLALLLGLRYRNVVTLRRVRAMAGCFWLLAFSLGGLYLSWFLDLNEGGFIAFIIFLVLITLCLITSVYSYIKIYLRLRHHHLQVHGHVQQAQPPNNGTIPLNIARYKKTVFSIIWVQLVLLTCYLPLAVVGMLFISEKIPESAVDVATLIIYSNSSLNPIIYCWKIREVKQAVKDTVRQLNCCCESQ